MKYGYVFLISLATLCQANAQESYSTLSIKKELLAYAGAVVRNSDEVVEVKDMDNSIYRITRAVTILNASGDGEAEIAIWHNKSNIIKNLKGAIYDDSGKLTGKIAEKNFEDLNAANDFSLFEDSHIKRYRPAIAHYPYTITYEYEVRAKQTLNFESWRPNAETGVAIEKSSFTFTCKPDFLISYTELNVPEKAVVSTSPQGLKSYRWQAANVKSIKTEPFAPNAEKYLTIVKIAPQKFNYEGIAGSFTNWNELGKWVYDKLLKGRDELSPETVDHIRQLTVGITAPKEKAQKVYEYMQQKTRYVSIQVGIGGYKPFLAADVDRTSYGDCKALVNYTQALLKVAGIPSWYCLVYAGTRKRSLLTNFASMDQANHIILCLPFKNDTTWLECTSQQIPFGFLGDFTDDREVLACTADGGKLLKTPAYNAETNITKRRGHFSISEKGELSGTLESRFSGTEYETREDVKTEPYAEQVKFMQRAYPVNNLYVDKLTFTDDKVNGPSTIEKLQLAAPDYATLNSGKFYFKLNAANRLHNVPPGVRTRLTDVYLNRGFTEDDELIYTIPPGYHAEKQLPGGTIDKPFGKFSYQVTKNGQQLTYKRLLMLKDGTYPKDSYEGLVELYDYAANADNYTMVLIKDS